MKYAVVGCNYGDEGKGLATDFLASRSRHALGVRHNGGAQSGHTVEIGAQRFVFHELSSGSFRGADTYWAQTYFPDLYKLEEEMQDFREAYRDYIQTVTGTEQGTETAYEADETAHEAARKTEYETEQETEHGTGSKTTREWIPRIYASSRTCMTTIDDVLINQYLELSRGEGRHGSCGMGINEADLRGQAGYAIPLGDVEHYSPQDLYAELKRIRIFYTSKRLEELGLTEANCSEACREYRVLLTDDAVIYNFACAVILNMQYVTLTDDPAALMAQYEDVIFESGQGLCLDAEYEPNWPHVTASRTGITNPVQILGELGEGLDEVLYVTRTYVTKHGAGPLSNEIGPERKENNSCSVENEILVGTDEERWITFETDRTNVENPWQGSIRAARFDRVDSLVQMVARDQSQIDTHNQSQTATHNQEDMDSCNPNRSAAPMKKSLLITHLNETNHCLVTREGNIEVNSLIAMPAYHDFFDKFYGSATRFASEIEEIRKS